MKKRYLLTSLLAVVMPLSLALPTAWADPASPAVPTASPAATQAQPVVPTVVPPTGAVGFDGTDDTITTPPNTCGPELPTEKDDSSQSAAADPAVAAVLAGSLPSKDGAAAAPAPAPEAPAATDRVTSACASNQIEMFVKARPFEYHFGDVVQVEIGIKAGKGAIVDPSPLVAHGQLYMLGQQQFEVIGQPVYKVDHGEDGSTIYHIILQVRQFLPAPFVKFYAQLPYAVAMTPSGTPLWQILQTPDFVIAQDAVGVKGMAQPVMGNAEDSRPRMTWALVPLAVLGTVLLLLWPVWAAMRHVNRVLPRKNRPRRAEAWLALDRVRRSGTEMGFSANHYGRISQILRQLLDTDYPGLKSMTAVSIKRTFGGDLMMDKLASALAKVERVIVGNGKLTADEHKQLLAEVDEIVPRPNNM